MIDAHLALCVGGSYVEPGAVVVASALAHFAGAAPLTVWVLHDGMSPAQEQLYKAAAGSRATLHLVPTPAEITALPSMSDYITSATFGRLALPDVLPSDVDRVLYLDADLLVVGDLAPLCAYALDGAALAAVREPSDPFFWSRNGLEHVFTLDVDRWTPYFNAGVLVMDLPLIRELEVRGRCLEYVAEHCPARMDQDALNFVLRNRIAELPTMWNVENYFFKSSSRRARYEALLAEAKALHYVGHNKPWNQNVWRVEEWRAHLAALEGGDRLSAQVPGNVTRQR
jgi:lipopolysaccharide biosynthesis glycosyltransferase